VTPIGHFLFTILVLLKVLSDYNISLEKALEEISSYYIKEKMEKLRDELLVMIKA